MTAPSDTPPKAIIDLVAAFMRDLNTARLYAGGHDLFKKHSQELYSRLQEAMGDGDFLFLGCAKDTIFLEGTFYQAKDTHTQKFLKFFHSLGISHVLLDKKITTGELESFIGLLAGAKPGQGSDVSSALQRESSIKHVKLGHLDYTVFSSVQSVASQLAQASEDQAIWRQLIIQPAAAGSLNLSPEKTKELMRLTQDVEELKKLLLQVDSDMEEKHKGTSVTHRGIVLGNFIQNLGDTMAEISDEERSQFANHIGAVLDSLEPQLKAQILGAVAYDAEEEASGVIHEILWAMPDAQFVFLLIDALKEGGPNSPCFHNLFSQAMAKYEEPGLLLTIIRQETDRATREGTCDDLAHWQHLEQLLVQQQETDDLNKQYRKEIQALATSIQMAKPMVEEDETARLIETLTPASLRPAKAQLITDLLRNPHTTHMEATLPSLIEGFGQNLDYFLAEKQFVSVGRQLREISLAISDHPQQASVKKGINSLLTSEQVKELVRNLMQKCSTYKPEETTMVNAVCQLFPEKAAGFLLDMLGSLDDNESPQANWLLTILATLGPRLNRMLDQKLHSATDETLPWLLILVAGTKDEHLATSVERLTDHENHEIRLKAISTLGKLKAQRTIPRLAEIVRQKSWVKTKKIKSLQMAAAHALSEINTNEAREVLKEVASQGSGDLKTLCQKLIG